MRIERLELRAFGPFDDTTLELIGNDAATRSGVLHIVYGANEAGKSSALRALRGLLFGIAERSPDNFRFDYSKLRIGAALRDRRGTALSCVRRKGRVNTLRDADDKEPIEPAELSRFLGGIGEELFATMFGIDHPGLVAGGGEIVRGGGQVGQLLFAAGAGVETVRRLEQALAAEADELFKPRASVPLINKALSELDEARKAIRDAQLPSATWAEHDRALAAARERRDLLENELRHLQTEQRRLERFRDALPAVAARKKLLDDLAPLATARLLRKEFQAERVAALRDLAQAERAARDALAEVERMDKSLADCAVPQSILDRAELIEQVHVDLGSHRKALADLPQRQAEQRQLSAVAETLLRRLKPDLALADAEQFRLTDAEQARIEELAASQPGLERDVADAAARVADIEQKLANIQRRLGDLPPPRQADELRRGLRRLTEQGRLVEQAAAAREAASLAEESLSSALRDLRPWTGTAEALEALDAPTAETIDRFKDRLSAAAKDVKQAHGRLEEEQSQLADTSAELESARLAHEVPTEDDLSAARAARDAIWRLVRQTLEGESPDPAEQNRVMEAVSPGGTLATAHEAAARRADELADRLRREASRVEQKANLLATQKKQTARRDQFAARLAEQRAALDSARHEWVALWRGIGIEAGSPQEMAVWARRRQEVIAQLRDCRATRVAANRLNEKVTAHRVELAGMMQSLGEAPGEAELSELAGRAEELCERIAAVEAERARLVEEADRLCTELPAARARQAAAAGALDKWHAEWIPAVARQGLSGEARPAEARAVLRCAGELFAALDKIDGLRQRIAGIESDAARFADRVAQLSASVAPDLAGKSAEQAASQLHQRLTQAREIAAKRQALSERRERGAHALDAAGRTIAQTQAALRVLCQEAGCQTVEELPVEEDRSARRRDLQQQLQAREDELTARAGGMSIDEFALAVESHDPERLDLEIERLSELIGHKVAEKEAAVAAVTRHEVELGRMDGSARAAEEAERAAGLLAGVGARVEQYSRLKLAAAVLSRAIERYREKNQDPVLKRASQLFTQLTVGSFQGLCAQTEDGREVLVGVRGGTAEHVPVEGMSDGTADQLYLALRLASLERYLEEKEPVPLIVDDILIKFDDERSVATLRVLAELSRRTQVIFFTHHRHLVELAEKHLPAGAWSKHELSRSSDALAAK
jgi:uncharacterized protein YhaN